MENIKSGSEFRHSFAPFVQKDLVFVLVSKRMPKDVGPLEVLIKRFCTKFLRTSVNAKRRR
jgi:hypothetical protein